DRSRAPANPDDCLLIPFPPYSIASHRDRQKVGKFLRNARPYAQVTRHFPVSGFPKRTYSLLEWNTQFQWPFQRRFFLFSSAARGKRSKSFPVVRTHHHNRNDTYPDRQNSRFFSLNVSPKLRCKKQHSLVLLLR